MNALDLLTHRHGDPTGWSASDFEALTSLTDTYGFHTDLDLTTFELPTPLTQPAPVPAIAPAA
jgi:hypothetical protein